MAGYMYLGNKKVCPAIVLGGSPEPEPNNFFTLKLPDELTSLDSSTTISSDFFYKENGQTKYHPFKLDFNNVESISGYGWGNYANNLKVQRTNIAIDFGKIKKIGSGSDYAFAQAFYESVFCEGSTDIEFNYLEEITASSFGACFADSNITSIKFHKLNKIGNGAFEDIIMNCSNVDIYFYAVNSESFNTTAFRYICEYAENTTLHFPSNVSEVVPTLGGYPNFGGTNTTILYDLPATE